MSHLGIPTETKAFVVGNADARVRLTWLEDLYNHYIESGSYVWVATTYLLHLIGNMIFANKSFNHVQVAYLNYLGNMNVCHE